MIICWGGKSKKAGKLGGMTFWNTPLSEMINNGKIVDRMDHCVQGSLATVTQFILAVRKDSGK